MRISRSTGAFSGLLLIVLGAWGALVPFVGPYFNYAFGSDATWNFTTERLWLDVLPGAAVILGGAVLLWSGHRLVGLIAGWLAIAGGAWFVVGPALSRIWEGTSAPIGVPLYGPTRQAVELIGYFYGLGVLIVALGTLALVRFVSRPGLAAESAAVVAEPAAAVADPAAPVAEPQTPTAPVTAVPVAPKPGTAKPLAPVAAEPPLAAEPAGQEDPALTSGQAR